jgi:hypothetical protein
LDGSGVAINPCPPPQYADEKVGQELQDVPFEGHEDFWAWVDAVEKLNDQLTICRGGKLDHAGEDQRVGLLTLWGDDY